MVEHSSRQGLSRRYSRLARFFLPLVAIVVLLAGCGEGYCNCFTMRAPDLSGAHVHQISVLDKHLLESANSDYSDQLGAVLGLATYQVKDAQYLLVSMYGSLYAAALPNGPATLVGGITCGNGTISLAANASRLACLNNQPPYNSVLPSCVRYCSGEELQVANYVSTSSQSVAQQTLKETAYVFVSPTWRYDGGALAVLEVGDAFTSSGDCRIAMYSQISSNDSRIEPALYLSATGISLCDVVQIAWSPDGQSLAVLTPQELLLFLAPSPSVLMQAARSGQRKTLALHYRRRIIMTQRAHGILWAPDSNSVTIVSQTSDSADDEVNRYSLDTSTPPVKLLNLSTAVPNRRIYSAAIGAIAYSPDRRTLLFSYGAREAGLLASDAGSISGENLPNALSGKHTSLSVFRPQVCYCPQPPTGLYAYTLPTS
jgi:hypothetical protein